MDFLADIVSTMHLRSALYARFEATAPWAVRFAPGSQRARFGLVTQGTCWLSTASTAEPIALRNGDCFLNLDGAPFAIGDTPQTPPLSCAQLMQTSSERGGRLIRIGGGGSPAAMITGWFSFDPASSEPLTRLLPPLMHFRVDDERAVALEAAFDLLARETTGNDFGKALMIRGLADVLLVEAMRIYLSSAEHPQQGVIAALADPRLSRALQAIHRDAARSWTVAALAGVSGMSRSAFAQHFHNVLGTTPLDYLTEWRMHIAMRLLRADSQPLIAIAQAVGYQTDSAFAKAFRRFVGTTPGAYRKEQRGSDGAVVFRLS